MSLTRRDFLKATSALTGALGVRALLGPEAAWALEAEDGGVPVLWLQAQGCTGCSVSLLNSIEYGTVDGLLLNTLDLDYHPTVMAGAGEIAVSEVEDTYDAGGYVLVVEGAIPVGEGGKFCSLWPGMTAVRGVERYAAKAGHIIAVGTCACYGGMAAGQPNPTGAQGVRRHVGNKTVINLPGCPAHPDWVVGTIAYLIKYGRAPELDTLGRPKDFFQEHVHDRCPNRRKKQARTLSEPGCLNALGCNGPNTRADCPVRKWNAPDSDSSGVNWCVGAGAPCLGCTDPRFPDRMSPFYKLWGNRDGRR